MAEGDPTPEWWESDDWQWFGGFREIGTEADWFTCPSPGPLADYLNQRAGASVRKFFLAGAACVRRVWHLLERAESRAAVEAAEHFADGALSREQLSAIITAADNMCDQWSQNDARWYAARAAGQFHHCVRNNHGRAEYTIYALSEVPNAVAHIAGSEGGEREFAKQAEMRVLATLYRCVMGNPFRPVAFDPVFRSETAVAIASGIYEQRAFDRLPILADALEEAGCDHPDVLTHCRGPGPHARGCWVVDGVLGKQ